MDLLNEHGMRVGSHRTRVLELDGDGPGFVLLHGWGDSADTWRPLLAELASRGRRAIAVDLPGFGRASRLAPGAILPQLDAFAAALVHEWGAGEPVVIAGSSLGGCVALRAAERGDLPLAGVMPVATAGLERPAWFDAVERDPIVRALLDIPIPVPNALVHTEPRALRSDRMLPSAPFDLTAAACPVMLAWGAHDRTAPRTSRRRALDALPETRVELIEDCGGAPQVEAADRLLELLLAFPA